MILTCVFAPTALNSHEVELIPPREPQLEYSGVYEFLDTVTIAGTDPSYTILVYGECLKNLASIVRRSITCETLRDKQTCFDTDAYASPSRSMAVLYEMRNKIPMIMKLAMIELPP